MTRATPGALDVLVVGGGIGGLTAAIALRQRGVAARVYEAAPALTGAGAGILLPSNALAVLARLGLADAARAAGVPVLRGEVHDAADGLLQAFDFAAVERRYGHVPVAIHRARLQALLVDALPADAVTAGTRCAGVEPGAGSVRVRFADGTDARAGVVVGADGLRSTMRAHVLPDARLRYAGQTSHRAVVRLRLPPEQARGTMEVWGGGPRFGYAAVGEGEIYWFSSFDAPAGGGDTPEREKAALVRLAADFPEPIPTLVAATDAEAIIRTDLYDLPPARSWHRGRVVLLGDAAHATTPNLGQGGAQAIEDGWVLARELAGALAAGTAPEEAFAAYERVRWWKAQMVVTRSWQFGRLSRLGGPVGRRVRNWLIRHTPERTTLRQLDRLYGLDY